MIAPEVSYPGSVLLFISFQPWGRPTLMAHFLGPEVAAAVVGDREDHKLVTNIPSRTDPWGRRRVTFHFEKVSQSLELEKSSFVLGKIKFSALRAHFRFTKTPVSRKSQSGTGTPWGRGVPGVKPRYGLLAKKKTLACSSGK